MPEHSRSHVRPPCRPGRAVSPFAPPSPPRPWRVSARRPGRARAVPSAAPPDSTRLPMAHYAPSAE
eukprot:7438793-Pyramimonas_sp.AAC.1